MEKNYSKALARSNIIFGIHCLVKGILILLLFIILYSIIWIKEKYLNYLKISIYIQLFIFLFLIAVILVTNNPNFFDMCFKCILYIFLFLSIFQIIIIVLEFFGVIQNFNNFRQFFHECPYYRKYNDIIDSKYQRTCLFYNEDPYSEERYKYLCFYNSEEEYYNKFCDGLICKQNNNFFNKENDFTKCLGININLVTFPDNSIYFQKEKLLFDKRKNKKFFLCSKKKRIDKFSNDDDNNNNDNNNDDNSKYKINNIECPDNNPSKKYIVFIYIELIFHISVDFLFIYEFFVVKNLNKLFFDMNEICKLKIIDGQSNSSKNRDNKPPSVNGVIINIDKKKINYENSEDIKIEDSYVKDNNENKNINLNIDINDNRRINIIKANQDIKICKNADGGTILINGLKNPKEKGRLKNRRLKEKERKVNKFEDEDYIYITNKRHNKLKSSQLKNLINISLDNDNDEKNSYKEENNINIENKKNRKINIINKEISNFQKLNKNIFNKKETEKCNKTTYGKNLIFFDMNNKYFPINNKIEIGNKKKREKIMILKKEKNNSDNYNQSLNHSFDLKQYIDKKNINKNNQNIIESTNNEFLSDDDNSVKKEWQLNNIKE